MERKLAAILAADVVGYSRLMEEDESGTFARLRAHRKELFEPEIVRHHGRVFKLMGDGLLAEFASAVNAVECAIVLQRGLAERNTGLPDGQRIDCRIGVNLGDLIVESDSGADMHGDGVNIANRLQALAEPGDVLISGAVYDQLKKKVEAGFEFLGEQKVKNIAEPIRLYRVLHDSVQAGRTVRLDRAKKRAWLWPSAAAAAIAVLTAGVLAWTQPWRERIEVASVEHMALPLPDKPSIAVLPFANMSDDPKQEYFADGITDDLITELSKLSGLFVISRNSTFVYKGQNVPPKRVSEELGVRYVLEGSVQRAGNQLRINAQLIDALSGGHAWADRFDGTVDNIFALQDKVTRSIADALAVKLNATEQQALEAPDTAVPAAYDAYLRGMENYRLTNPQAYGRAIPLFEEAIRLDPAFGRAYGALALLYVRVYSRNYAYELGLTPPQALERAQAYAEQAKKRSPAASHQVAGYILMSRDGDLFNAMAQLREAIALDPGDFWNYVLMAWALTGSGQAAEALEYIQTAQRLNPNDAALTTYWLGLVQFGLQQYEQAAKTLEAAARMNPEDEYAYLMLAAIYGQLGRTKDAEQAVSRWNEIRVGKGDLALTVESAPRLALKHFLTYDRYMQGLLQAGVPQSFSAEAFARPNRLTAEEVRTLLFGHRIYSRDFLDGLEGTATITAEGAYEATGLLALLRGPTAHIRFSGDRLCVAISTNLSECATILRNPGGTREKFNQYIWVGSRGTYPFAQVE